MKAWGRKLVSRAAKVFFLALLLVWSVGCSAQPIKAVFPDVTLQQLIAPGVKIGVAHVEDSRASLIAGRFEYSDLQVGPGLADYIERKFRNQLTDQGFDAIEAPDPAQAPVNLPYKVVVVTLQSATFEITPSEPWRLEPRVEASVNIAVRLYAASTRKEIYSGSFSGSSNEGWGLPSSVGSRIGSIIAVAADHATGAIFTDTSFEQALK